MQGTFVVEFHHKIKHKHMMELLVKILIALGSLTTGNLTTDNLDDASVEKAQSVIDNNQYHLNDDGGVVIDGVVL